MFNDWQWYKDLFQITFLRYFAVWFSLVPILYLLIKDIPKEVTIAIGMKSYTLNFELPFSWEILWVSSFCYVLALLTYLIRVPTFIKRYPSYAEYKSHTHSPRWIIWEMKSFVKENPNPEKLVTRLKEKGYLTTTPIPKDKILPYVDVNNDQTILYFKHNNSPCNVGMPRIDTEGNELKEVSQIAEREIFWELFARIAESRKCARNFIGTLLPISFSLALIILVNHIWTALSGPVLDFLLKLFQSS